MNVSKSMEVFNSRQDDIQNDVNKVNENSSILISAVCQAMGFKTDTLLPGENSVSYLTKLFAKVPSPSENSPGVPTVPRIIEVEHPLNDPLTNKVRVDICAGINQVIGSVSKLNSGMNSLNKDFSSFREEIAGINQYIRNWNK